LKIFTIGFAQTSAAEFFGKLKGAGVRRLLDVRLNNTSQLAAYAKRDDLKYFLRAICDAEYKHEPLLAPTQEMLDVYKKQRGSWHTYEKEFLNLLARRRVERELDRESFQKTPTALLCSERVADHCHRRVVLEYLDQTWGDVFAVHL
jgi:uncharacterized protein (DUF488 family)